MNNEIVIFENQKIKLEVNVKDETVWLTQSQMAELFASSRTNIVEHINNIYELNELDKSSTCQIFRQVRKEGNREVTRNIPYYNLDMIISVGYRVNSKKGILFRKWANGVLKDYLLKGYTANEERLKFLEKKVQLIDIASRIEQKLNDDESKEIIKVINNYSNALNLLDDYDHRTLIKPKGTKTNDMITYDNCVSIINLLKTSFDSDIFALERDNGLKSIINDIYLSFDGIDVYNTVEEKAANFLYLIVKNHVFIDGNKRIAATLFIYFLNFYDLLLKDNMYVIDNNTLVAITLLIAESNPSEKSIIIDLVMNFLKSK